MTPKAFLVGEATRALRYVDAYGKVVDLLVTRAEIATHMLDLSDDALARATFLRSRLDIVDA